MNIVTPIQTTQVAATYGFNTEAARRDNVLRETIPQPSDAEQSASQKGLGSESDRARPPGQPPAPLTYERPQVQNGAEDASPGSVNDNQDNANDESAGKENAKEQQRQASQQEIETLKARDQEVRTHEQAHAAVGGQYAGAPQYEYTQGPDGKRYVTDGEVSIDISEAASPQETAQKMERVRAAALAPAEPSPQDLKVAAEAARKAAAARSEMSAEQAEVLTSGPSTAEETSDRARPPNLDELIDNPEISIPRRSLSAKESQSLSEKVSGEVQPSQDNGQRALESRERNSARSAVIQRFYAASVTPDGAGFNASA